MPSPEGLQPTDHSVGFFLPCGRCRTPTQKAPVLPCLSGLGAVQRKAIMAARYTRCRLTLETNMMTVQGFGHAASAYAVMQTSHNNRSMPAIGAAAVAPAQRQPGAQLTLSDQAKALVASDQDIAARLDAIKAKPAVRRTGEESDFVLQHDQRFANLVADGSGARTADDLDYMQKASGMVNTMANLSPSEKQLYDTLVAKGDTKAVEGLALIALSRTGSGDVTLGDGTSFNPNTTAITPQNIRSLFSQLFVGDSRQTQQAFEALAAALDGARTTPA